MERELKYGCNPHQPYAALESLPGCDSPIEIRNGNPSMINLLDALNSWQLVAELRAALDLPAASRARAAEDALIGKDVGALTLIYYVLTWHACA